MKKNKGFTLVELLAVIVIIGIIIGIAVPSVIGISRRMQTNMYCTKITVLEKNAIRYAQDQDDLQVLTGEQDYTSITKSESKIKVQNLIPNYIKADDMDNGKVIDPRSGESMNDLDVYVYIKNKRPYAKIPGNEDEALELCAKK